MPESESLIEPHESVPGVVRQQGLMVVLQESFYLVQDVKPPVIKHLSQICNSSHAYLLS